MFPPLSNISVKKEAPKTKSVSFAATPNADTKDLTSHRKRSIVSISTEVDEEVDDVYGVDITYDEGGTFFQQGENILHPKRKRMSHSDDDEGNGEEGVDANYSLLYDDSADTFATFRSIPVEAFNLNEERTNGDGYFEGDMYIFRRRKKSDEDDEWLKSLKDDAQEQYLGGKESEDRKKLAESESDGSEETSTDATRLEDKKLEQAQVLRDVLALLKSPKETVSEAMRRYGRSCRQQLKNQAAGKDTEFNDYTNAKQSLYKLTSLANELVMLYFEHDVYSKSAEELKQWYQVLFSEQKSQAHSETKYLTPSLVADMPVQWEYCGQDSNMYGPFTTEQMMQWLKQGYFLGDSAVRVRKVHSNMLGDLSSIKREKTVNTVEDLVADLEESEHEEFEANGQRKNADDQWLMSDKIDFSKYVKS